MTSIAGAVCRRRIQIMACVVPLLQLTTALAAFGQESADSAPPRITLPAGLWFGMKYDAVRTRLTEQGMEISKLPKPHGQDLRRATMYPFTILRKRANRAAAVFQADSALVGLELEYGFWHESERGEMEAFAWSESVRSALEGKYGPPQPGDERLSMAHFRDREEFWVVGDSDIRFARHWMEGTLDERGRPVQFKPGSFRLLQGSLSYRIPPLRPPARPADGP